MLGSAYIALGANLSEPNITLERAINRLSATADIRLRQRSRLYRTVPIDAAGPDFCNAVIEIVTGLNPLALLKALLHLESEFGRTRLARHAPRTLDLDLIAHEGQRVESDSLTLPHPRAHGRAFVLIPLCELNEAVLLGPPESQALRTAGFWRDRLSSEQRKQVIAW
ncbi:MAG: 2-amino-4-hydroxy-6-hydroxymethyldihydropteridine diphosphokinase [Burkholderiaceae bacterium]|jgi:2-amino-4-hydroxy-6-hydroxymethyldihydropteridine diphosphokinase